MNKIFRNKNIVQKIIILVIILISFNFIFPVIAMATDAAAEDSAQSEEEFTEQTQASEGDWMENVAGPITNTLGKFIRGLGDSLISLMQRSFMPGSPPAIDYQTLLQAYASVLKVQANEAKELGNKTKAEELEAKIKEVEEKDADYRATWGIWGFELIDIGEANLQGDYWNGYVSDLREYMGIKNLKGESDLDADYRFKMKIASERLVSIIQYTPRAIFSNIIPAFDVNFIHPRVKTNKLNLTYDYDVDENANFTVTPKLTAQTGSRK